MEYVTIEDIALLWRKLSFEESEQAKALIPIVTDELKQRFFNMNKDMDKMVEENKLSANIVKSVIVDIIARAIDQNFSDNSISLSQESQSANGYSWSGSYVNTGGGLTILNKDLKRLGLKRQTVRFVEMYDYEDKA